MLKMDKKKWYFVLERQNNSLYDAFLEISQYKGLIPKCRNDQSNCFYIIPYELK